MKGYKLMAISSFKICSFLTISSLTAVLSMLVMVVQSFISNFSFKNLGSIPVIDPANHGLMPELQWYGTYCYYTIFNTPASTGTCTSTQNGNAVMTIFFNLTALITQPVHVYQTLSTILLILFFAQAVTTYYKYKIKYKLQPEHEKMLNFFTKALSWRFFELLVRIILVDFYFVLVAVYLAFVNTYHTRTVINESELVVNFWIGISVIVLSVVIPVQWVLFGLQRQFGCCWATGESGLSGGTNGFKYENEMVVRGGDSDSDVTDLTDAEWSDSLTGAEEGSDKEIQESEHSEVEEVDFLVGPSKSSMGTHVYV